MGLTIYMYVVPEQNIKQTTPSVTFNTDTQVKEPGYVIARARKRWDIHEFFKGIHVARGNTPESFDGGIYMVVTHKDIAALDKFLKARKPLPDPEYEAGYKHEDNMFLSDIRRAMRNLNGVIVQYSCW